MTCAAGAVLDDCGVCGGNGVINADGACATCYSTDWLDYNNDGVCIESLACCAGLGGTEGSNSTCRIGDPVHTLLPVCQ